MAVLGQAAEDHLGVALRDLPLTEVYSCFPAAVRVQQRELGLDPGGTPTLTGGMSFAGGPFNNFVFNATAALVGQLRQQPEQLGLMTTVSGMLSKPGLAVWSCTPPPAGALLADLGPATMAATELAPVAEPGAARGPATVVSSTVTYGVDDPLEPVRTAVVLDLPDGTRTAATCEDPLLAAQCVAEGIIGRVVHVEGTTFTP
jgi:acetyl-CoA C-acetyltransferase